MVKGRLLIVPHSHPFPSPCTLFFFGCPLLLPLLLLNYFLPLFHPLPLLPLEYFSQWSFTPTPPPPILDLWLSLTAWFFLFLFLCSSSIFESSMVSHSPHPPPSKKNCVAHHSFHHPLSLVFDLRLSLTWFIGPTIPHSSSLLESFFFYCPPLLLVWFFFFFFPPNKGFGGGKKKGFPSWITFIRLLFFVYLLH